MNSFWKSIVVLSILIAAASCLDCKQCKIGVLGNCFFGNDVSCSSLTESCYTGQAQFNASQSLTLISKGCIDSDLCGSALTGSILGVAFTSSITCCNTDLCNGASSVQLPLTVALCAAILSSLWGSLEF
ncbi:PREDICTED: sperm acrosome membrane-associated protein 4-like [Cyprinodon variegatus]|uniref:sperm acrosome membrane-associated protein 4-like n=1 Tax=Cyprinodon variegatus TaxID=28743 RepID=UPI000742BD99|nr:PREDICTED: sperm acrosome membrane-associated protein 4-like [Cyprinodon variegatus]